MLKSEFLTPANFNGKGYRVNIIVQILMVRSLGHKAKEILRPCVQILLGYKHLYI
jgi:hypothetical protein